MEQKSLQICRWKEKPHPATIELHEWSAKGHLIIRSPSGEIWLSIFGPIGLLAAELRRLAEAAEQEAARYHSAEGMEAAGIKPGETSHAITINNLIPGNSRHNWRLIVERFPWLFAKEFDPDKYAEQLHKALANPEQPAAPSQAEQDLALVRPRLAEVLKADGSINQSAVGRVIGVRNAGSGRERVLRVCEALIASSTSTPTQGQAEQGKEAGEKRAA